MSFQPEGAGEARVVSSRALTDAVNAAVLYHNPLDNVYDLARHFFGRCLEARVVPYVVTKKTVFKWQDEFWRIHKTVRRRLHAAAACTPPPSSLPLTARAGGAPRRCTTRSTSRSSRSTCPAWRAPAGSSSTSSPTPPPCCWCARRRRGCCCCARWSRPYRRPLVRCWRRQVRWRDGGFGMVAHNYDGDMLTDEMAAVHRSPGFVTSALIGKAADGTLIKEFEASHGAPHPQQQHRRHPAPSGSRPLARLTASVDASRHGAGRHGDGHALCSAMNHSAAIAGRGEREMDAFTSRIRSARGHASAGRPRRLVRAASDAPHPRRAPQEHHPHADGGGPRHARPVRAAGAHHRGLRRRGGRGARQVARKRAHVASLRRRWCCPFLQGHGRVAAPARLPLHGGRIRTPMGGRFPSRLCKLLPPLLALVHRARVPRQLDAVRLLGLRLHGHAVLRSRGTTPRRGRAAHLELPLVSLQLAQARGDGAAARRVHAPAVAARLRPQRQLLRAALLQRHRLGAHVVGDDPRQLRAVEAQAVPLELRHELLHLHRASASAARQPRR
eukprot:scaffold134_cov268-Prasinococcus_capsulatus_cf.AAC.2